MAAQRGLLAMPVTPTPVMGGLLGVPGVDDVSAGPPDMSDSYNTQLSSADEAKFRSWLGQLSKAKGYDAAKDLVNYDLRGAWKGGAGRSANGHFPDTFKKPNHPTFSSESQYSGGGMIGGDWVENGGKWEFRASPFNLRMSSPEALGAYFRQVEPDSALILPSGVQPTPVGLLGGMR